MSLPAVTVKGRRVDHTAFKMPQAEREVPRSLDVVEAAEIRQRNLRFANEAFDYVPGFFNNSYNQAGYHFYSRGYRIHYTDTRVDGFGGANDHGSYMQTLFGVERMVLLRGPAGLLHGPTDRAGGLVNLVTKRPEAEAAVRLDQRVSSYAGGGVGFGARSSYLLDLDATGPLAGAGQAQGRPMLYRLLYRSENHDHFVANNLRRSECLQVDLAWELEDGSRVRAHAQKQFHLLPALSDRVSPSTSLGTADGDSVVRTGDLNSLNVNLAAGGRTEEHFVAGFDLEKPLADGFSLRQSYRFRDFDTEINQWTVNTATLAQKDPADPASWRVQRRQARSLKQRWNHGLDLGLQHDSGPGASWRSRALAGFYAHYFGTDRDDASPSGANQSWVNVYSGVPEAAVADTAVMSVRNPLAKDLNWNAYLQDQLALFDEALVLTLGLGYGEQLVGRNYGAASTLPPANIASVTAARRGQLDPNAALMWNLTRALGLYASYATSFLPANGEWEDAQGRTGLFSPQTGVNYEVGAKLESEGRRWFLGLDAYWNEMTNTLRQTDAGVVNTLGNRYYIQAQGEGLLSRGGEISLGARPLAGLELELGAAHIDAFNRTSTYVQGALPQKTPRWSCQGSGRWTVQEGTLRGLGLSFGAIWQQERAGADRTTAAPDPLMLPAFTRLDAGVFYEPGTGMDFALNVDNVLDELVFVGGATGAALETAPPRTVTLRAGLKI